MMVETTAGGLFGNLLVGAEYRDCQYYCICSKIIYEMVIKGHKLVIYIYFFLI